MGKIFVNSSSGVLKKSFIYLVNVSNGETFESAAAHRGYTGSGIDDEEQNAEKQYDPTRDLLTLYGLSEEGTSVPSNKAKRKSAQTLSDNGFNLDRMGFSLGRKQLSITDASRVSDTRNVLTELNLLNDQQREELFRRLKDEGVDSLKESGTPVVGETDSVASDDVIDAWEVPLVDVNLDENENSKEQKGKRRGNVRLVEAISVVDNLQNKPVTEIKSPVEEIIPKEERYKYYAENLVDDLKVLYPNQGDRSNDTEWKTSVGRLNRFRIRWILKPNGKNRDFHRGGKMRRVLENFLVDGKADQLEDIREELKISGIGIKDLIETQRNLSELKSDIDKVLAKSETVPVPSLAPELNKPVPKPEAAAKSEAEQKEEKVEYYANELVRDLQIYYGKESDTIADAGKRLDEVGVKPLNYYIYSGPLAHGVREGSADDTRKKISKLNTALGENMASLIQEYLLMESGVPGRWKDWGTTFEKSGLDLNMLEEARKLLHKKDEEKIEKEGRDEDEGKSEKKEYVDEYPLVGQVEDVLNVVDYIPASVMDGGNEWSKKKYRRRQEVVERLRATKMGRLMMGGKGEMRDGFDFGTRKKFLVGIEAMIKLMSFQHVLREKNKEADKLVNDALDK